MPTFSRNLEQSLHRATSKCCGSKSPPLHFEQFRVTLVLWIRDGVQELAVAPGTADILRRTTPGALYDAWIDDTLDRRGDAFQHDHAAPAVAVVIKILFWEYRGLNRAWRSLRDGADSDRNIDKTGTSSPVCRDRDTTCGRETRARGSPGGL